MSKLQQTDHLVFMEYITPSKYSVFQEDLAYKLRKANIKFKLHGFIHLPVNYILQNKICKNTDQLKAKLKLLDKLYVFGSSLQKDLQSLSFKNVVKTYHYVDTNYYEIISKKEEKETINIVIVGFIMRDFKKLKQIIAACPEVRFDFCMGRFDHSQLFKDMKNISFYGLLSESELKNIMQKADISLNVFEDTIGSNVITTSMACGLVIIASDVGSIRDYCDSSNAFFCKQLEEYIDTIKHLSQNRDVLHQMGEASRRKAEKVSLENFNEIIFDLIS